jgi:glycosyltransferase involved in cell wall biosynthesis
METSTKPVVSVIIPTYNRADVIGRSIKSVLSQTYPDFELIIIDDGSTDNTEEVVKSFNDPRIYFIQREQNRGSSAARNIGIKAARGEFIAFLDDDDEWLPAKLMLQLQVFRESKMENIGLVLCGMTVIGLNNSKEWCLTKRGWIFDYLLSFTIINGVSWLPCWLVKKSLAYKVGQFDNMETCEDIDWLLRTARLSQIDYVPQSLVRVHQERQYDITLGFKRRLTLIEKYSSELSRLPYVLHKCHKRLALRYRRQENIRLIRQQLALAIKAYPFSFRPYIWLLASLLGRWPFIIALKLLPDVKETL